MTLNSKQEKFVNYLIEGSSQREAYKKAYNAKYKDEAIDAKASALFKKDKVQVRYNELLDQLADKSIITAKLRMKWLSDIINNKEKEDIYYKDKDGIEVNFGSKNADLSTKLKACDILNKMSGVYSEKLKLSNDKEEPFEINVNVVK